MKVRAYDLIGSAGQVQVLFEPEGSSSRQTLTTVLVSSQNRWELVQTGSISVPGAGRVIVQIESESEDAPTYFDDLEVSIFQDIEGQYFDPNVYRLSNEPLEFVLFQDVRPTHFFR